ncbi:PP2C family serine/threonine-protein phosphatase [Sanguibacter sp. HDW7]|uniref:PP2C family protein-serine/threonine phosphatase n=1 Tax=Sanguibacter sp. HDW7 TaxID=2714931 RepID=UPI001407A9AC|nr:protein phosphatase 2C domain-containing protein [Sanguibacter sp. HDW7]QIK82616.1 serine/threonine-protein phosphatase [Sanguibacter sp. HDW7]
MHTLWGSATDRGRIRSLNEDALLAVPPVFLVADGMGGHDAGNVASRIVVDAFSTLVGHDSVAPDAVHDAFTLAGARMRETLGARIGGTTVAGAAVTEVDGAEYWLVFNIGDSRVYRVNDGALEQVSVDHSVVQELVDRGEISLADARVHPERHVITRAVGTGSDPDPDYWLIPVAANDRLMLCSDGLTSELDDETILQALTTLDDPQQAADWLVGAAVEAGGRDNVTVVVVDVASTWMDLPIDDATVTRGSLEKIRAQRRAAGGTRWDEELHGETVPREAVRTPAAGSARVAPAGVGPVPPPPPPPVGGAL